MISGSHGIELQDDFIASGAVTPKDVTAMALEIGARVRGGRVGGIVRVDPSAMRR